MSYRIVVDSCGEFTEEMERDPHFVHVALRLNIDGEEFVDDETFDRLDFLKKMKYTVFIEFVLETRNLLQLSLPMFLFIFFQISIITILSTYRFMII